MTVTNLSKTTLFTTPIISHICRLVALVIVKLIGWRIHVDIPAKRKFVLAAAPHTSNWDFALFLLLAFIVRMDLHWMGKDALFPFPFRRLMIWLGGIPIDRSQSNNVVGQMVEHFDHAEELIVIVPPEGTRSKVDRWKTGFYHIATQANVPIMLGYIDADTKTFGFSESFQISGDMDKDMQAIQLFYSKKKGLKPENQ